MTTLYTAGDFKVVDHTRKFADVREAIDAVSAFEAATLEDWEYVIEAANDDLQYVVKLHALVRIGGKLVRGYLAKL